MEALNSWETFAVAAAALLIILALILLGRFRFTVRFRGAVSVSPWELKPCPHLGLLDEPFIHRDEPNDEHRCYLWMQRDRIDMAHQKGFCLSSAHVSCPWLSIAPPVAKPPPIRRISTGAAAFAAGSWRVSRKTVSGSLAWLRRLLGQIARPVWALLQRAAPRTATAAKTLGRGGKIGVVSYAWLKRTMAQSARQIGNARRVQAVQPADQPDQALPGQVPVAPAMETVPAEGMAGGEVAVLEAAAPKRRGRPRKTPAPAAEGAMIGAALAALELGDEEKAYRLFVSATELYPASEKAWFWRAKAATTLDEVVSCLEQALAINPANEKVKVNLHWAIQRKQKEDAAREAEQQVDAKKVEAAHEEQPRRNLFAVGCRWLAGALTLALSLYWLLAALQPAFQVPAVKKIAEESAWLSQVDAFFTGAARWLPGLGWSALPWSRQLEVAEGYNLLAALPYIVGCVYFFVALGLPRRERWSHIWGLVLTVAGLALSALFATNPTATISLLAVGLLTVLSLLTSWRGLGQEADQDQRYLGSRFSGWPAGKETRTHVYGMKARG